MTAQLVTPDSAQAIAQRATDEIEALLKDRPATVLGIATGSSPLLLHDEFTARYAAGRLSFAEVTGFMLDEHAGLSAGHPERYATFMETNLRSHVGIRPGTLHGPDALSEDLETACRDYEAQMARAGYYGLQVLGIGSGRHIGSNRPGDALDSRTHLGELHEQARRDNAHFFGSNVGAAPTQCITQELATIVEARKLVLVTTGEGKAEAIAQLVEGEVGAQWLAIVTQCHDNALVLTGPATAGWLTSVH